MRNINEYIEQTNIKTIYEDIIGNGTRDALTNNMISNAAPNSSYWAKNKQKLGNFFWRDLALVGSLLVGLVAAPMILLLSKSIKSSTKRKEENDGKYLAYDSDTEDLITKKDNKISKMLKIGKINKKHFDAYIELTKDEKNKEGNFDNIANRAQSFEKFNDKKQNIYTGYYGIFLNNCCLALGTILSGKLVKDEHGIKPIIAFEIDKTTKNIGWLIQIIIEKMMSDNEINKIFNVKEGAYVIIENIIDTKNEENKKINESIIKQIGFDKIQSKEFGDLYYYTKTKHDEAIKKNKPKNNTK